MELVKPILIRQAIVISPIKKLVSEFWQKDSLLGRHFGISLPYLNA